MRPATRMNSFITLLVVVFAASASVYAQGPSDTNNTVPGAPTTAPPLVPTTPPPFPVPTTKKTPIGAVTPPPTPIGASGSGSLSTTPAPTTKLPKTPPPAPPANEAAVPAPTTPPPVDIAVDRSSKTEYGTTPPTTNETMTAVTAETAASKMGSWLVPAVIGAVIIVAVIVMSMFVRNRRDGDENIHRRGTDVFFAHPRTNTHQSANVAVLGDPVEPPKSKDQSSMRTVAVGGAPHSPRMRNKLASSPQSEEVHRVTSPDFGTYTQKPAEGSSVLF